MPRSDPKHAETPQPTTAVQRLSGGADGRCAAGRWPRIPRGVRRRDGTPAMRFGQGMLGASLFFDISFIECNFMPPHDEKHDKDKQ